MAQAPAQANLLKSEYLNMVPEFHGETELLHRFITICEKLVAKFYNTADESDFQNEYLMSSILAKIKGDAMLNISSCIINKWSDLKTALLNAYGDKRDLYTLTIELTELKQGNETPFEFYNRIIHVLNLKTAYINVHGSPDAKPVLQIYASGLALRVLLRGLKDPVGSLMRAKNPSDLSAALHMLTNDFQIESAKKYDHQNIKKPNPLPKQNHFNNFRHFQQLQLPPVQYYQPQQFNQVPRNNFANRNTNISTTQRIQQPSTSNNSPRTTTTQNSYKPTPMSISTRNTYRPPQTFQRTQNNFRNNGQQPNFIAEELFNIDDNSFAENTDSFQIDDSQIDNSTNENFENINSEHDNNENDDSQFFREPASKNNYQN